MSWSVEQLESQNVHRINIKYSGRDWSQRVLLISDRHRDNPKCRRDIEKKLMEQALKYNAPIIDLGDFFCAMQGKGDLRGSKGDVRPENDTPTYLDSLVDCAAEELAKYAHLHAIMATGNHETKVLKNKETDLTARIAQKLGAYTGEYRGFVNFHLSRSGSGSNSRTVRLYYTHGSGGGGQSNKGVTKAPRRAVYLNDIDIVVSGHIHECWYLELPQFVVTASGKVEHHTQYHIQLPTLKDEIKDGGRGWANESFESPPKPTGAWWLEFYIDNDRPEFRFIRAK